MLMHLTVDELRRWREGGTEADRARIVGHLAVCDACGARYAEVIRTRPAEAAPARFEPADFVARGERVFAPGSARRWGWTTRWAPALAAALIVVAGLAYVIGRPRERDAAYRGVGAGVELVRPIDARVAAAELVFEWRADEQLGPFRLRVIDLAAPEKPVIDRENARSGYTPAGDERQRLKPGVMYRWFVEYRSASGGVETSPAGRFEIE
jgi:hypothetical protein